MTVGRIDRIAPLWSTLAVLAPCGNAMQEVAYSDVAEGLAMLTLTNRQKANISFDGNENDTEFLQVQSHHRFKLDQVGRKCTGKKSAISIVGSQRACENRARDKGHVFFQFRSSDNMCATHDTCDDPKPDPGYNIYAPKGMWPLIHVDSKCSGKPPVKVADRMECQDLAEEAHNSLYQFNSRTRGCRILKYCTEPEPDESGWSVYGDDALWLWSKLGEGSVCSGKSKKIVEAKSHWECQTAAITQRPDPHMFYYWHAAKGKCGTSRRCKNMKPKKGWVVYEAPKLEENDFVVVVDNKRASQKECVGRTFRVAESQRKENKYKLIDETGPCGTGFGLEHLKLAQVPELSVNDWVLVLAHRIRKQKVCVGNRYKIKKTKRGLNQYWLVDENGCGSPYFNRHDLKLVDFETVDGQP